MFVMNQHQSNNTKKIYMASWLNGWVQKNVDLQAYFFTALPFLSENIKLHLIS
jgi:hypothetical protein